MSIIAAQEVIAEIKFGNRTSTIGTYLGKIYVHIRTDITDIRWFLDDTEELMWFFRFYKQEEPDRKTYTRTGGRVVTKVDWILRTLLGLESRASNESYRTAVSSSQEAQEWVRSLQKAKQSINSWYNANCPVNQKELDKAIEWSKTEPKSEEDTYNSSLGSRILSARRQALETKDGEKTRS